MASDTTVAPRDEWGLPKIDLGGGAGDQSIRAPQRAAVILGANITGQTFQTDGVDPRIVIDSTAMSAHNSSGSETFRLDVSTGTVTFAIDATVSGGVKFQNGGTIFSVITNDAARLLVDSIQDIYIVAETALGAASNVRGSLSLFVAGSAMLTAQSSATQQAVVGVTTTRVSLQNLDAGTLANVDIVAGHVIMSGSGVEKHIICALSTFSSTWGHRDVSAAAGNTHGGFHYYRQVRGTTGGALVTPASVTLSGAPIVSTNVSAASITIIRADGGELTITATAAGLIRYINTATAA